MAENKKLQGQSSTNRPSVMEENLGSKVVDDEEKKGQEAIMAILDQNSDKASDDVAQEEDVTSLYAAAKTKKSDSD